MTASGASRVAALCLAAALLAPQGARAHVGSPDVYADGSAGPYRLAVVIRPPLVIPGVAEVEVRAESPGVRSIAITPLALVGDAAKYPPTPDLMKTTTADPAWFTGQLWIMAPGSWQIRFHVSGASGDGVWSVPLPAAAMGTRSMQPALGVLLSLLGALLVAGMTGIVGAAAREAQLDPGAAPSPSRLRGARIAMVVTFCLLVTLVLLGNWWWRTDAADYASAVYKPLAMQAALQNGPALDLTLRDPGWFRERRLDDFIPDHNHIMHLYMIRWPQMDVVFHLHPDPVATGEFRLVLPTLPAGEYRLYADVVHASGFPETAVAAIHLPALAGRALSGDDAEGQASPVLSGSASAARFVLPDGYTMVWDDPAALAARVPQSFRFTLLDPAGRPAPDMQLYMGMTGHAAFIRTDGTVFAHIHPSGTMAMAALMMAQSQNAGRNASASASTVEMGSMPGMAMDTAHPPSTVSFPYGFPAPGQYRIVVQMKHGATVETGIFDAEAVAPLAPQR
jgi:hypothetical protein